MMKNPNYFHHLKKQPVDVYRKTLRKKHLYLVVRRRLSLLRGTLSRSGLQRTRALPLSGRQKLRTSSERDGRFFGNLTLHRESLRKGRASGHPEAACVSSSRPFVWL